MTKPTLKRTLIVHEVFFIFLVVLTGIIGLAWSSFWVKWSYETVRLTEMSRINENFGQTVIGELDYLRRKGRNLTNESLESTFSSIKRKLRQLDELRRLSGNRGEDYAIQRMQISFGGLLAFLKEYENNYSNLETNSNRHEVYAYKPNEFVLPYEVGWHPTTSRGGTFAWVVLSLKRDFHLHFLSVRGVIEKEVYKQDLSKQKWSTYAPFALSFPIGLAIVLLLISRKSLHSKFILPLRRVLADSEKLLEGRMDKNLPEVGVEEVRQLSREINIIASVLARSREELKSNERQAALAKLVPVVAHNVKNPLASIRANAQLLTGNFSIEELEESKIAILATVDKLTRWVNSLVSYLHPLQPKLEYFDLRKAVEGAVMLSGAPKLPKNLSITYVNWREPLRILADADLLEQAIFCLLSNAVDASPLGGYIEIGFLFRCDDVDLYIQDQGDGMPFEYQPTDFKPGPSTKEFGTGLGLPITQKVCDAHKFGLKFEKGMKKGTRAVISIIKVIER